MESDHMTAQTITVAGGRGGRGTSTVAAATALLLARHAATELVAAERDTTAALLGLTGPHDGCVPLKVGERLTLVSTPSGTAEMAVVDAQRLDQSTHGRAGCSWRCCGARAISDCGRSRPVVYERTASCCSWSRDAA
jgi:Mrp family chromosome partitioning ATPase